VNQGMNILVLENAFPPELMMSHFALEFVQELSKHAHSLSVVTVFPRKHLLKTPVNMPKGKFFYWDLNYSNINILRMFPQFRSWSKIGRALEYFASSVSLLIGGFILGKKDIIHAATPPIFVAFAACILAKLWRVPLVLRICDIHPDALEKIGVLRNKFLIGALKVIEKFVYSCSDHLTVVSPSYKEYLMNEGVPEKKITCIPNWVDLKDVHNARAHAPKYLFRKTFELENKFVITYAGSLSWINDLEIIIKSANLLKGEKEIVFVFVGEGIKKDLTVQMSNDLKLRNTVFIPSQPMEKYLDILLASDVCIVTLIEDFVSPALPSRIPSMLACAKSIIACVPYESDTYHLINDAKCGIWVNPGDAIFLADTILKLRNDGNANSFFGQNGRKYAEHMFSLESCITLYDQILRSVAN